MGDAKGPLSWLVKKGVKQLAKTVAGAITETMEQNPDFLEKFEFTVNGQKMSGADFKSWRNKKRKRRPEHLGDQQRTEL